MEASYVSLPTLEKLRAYVLESLCTREHLDPNQAPFFQGIVLRGGKPCGLLLQIEGPRLLKTHAIWLAQEDRILFYDSTGASPHRGSVKHLTSTLVPKKAAPA